jgi:hypothetical protein
VPFGPGIPGLLRRLLHPLRRPLYCAAGGGERTMSTILKALKKLEEDRRAAEPLRLSGKVLADGAGPARRRRRAWPIAAAAAGGGLAAALVMAGYFWLQSAPPAAGPAGVAPPGPAAVVAVVAPAAAPVPAAPKPAAAAAQRSAGLPQVLPRLQDPVSTPAAAVPQPAVQPAAPAAAGADRPAARPIPSAAQVRELPLLQVTEIFPATAGGERMAMVNGLPVMAGTRVEDALVKEIAADRVLFAIDGRIVAVPLTRAAARPVQNVQPSAPSSSQR